MKRPSDFLKDVEDAAQGKWVQLTVTTGEWKAKAEALVAEGKLRSIVVKKDSEVYLRMNLFVGTLAVLAAPAIATVGALVAVLQDSEIVLEAQPPKPTPSPRTKKTAKN